MQIVIDIPEEDYIRLRDEGMFGNVTTFKRAVREGTPLPKGHGRLIDVNELLDRIGLEDNDSNREDNVGEIITLEDFDFISPIIEADGNDTQEETDD